jgi:hypothetical protein
MKYATGSALICLALISTGLIATTSYAEFSEEDIAAMWLFDEGEGDVAEDSSPNGNDAMFNGGPKWTEGKFGKAISLDGADDYLSAGDSDSLDVVGEAMTLLGWINADAFPASWNHLIRKTPENPRIYILGVHNTALPFTFLKTDAQQVADVQGSTSLPTGEWVHLAMTYNGAEVTIYVNGEVDAISPASGTIEASDGELRIGRGDPAGYFTGTIDEVAIFRVALSPDEIKAIMDEGFAGFLSVGPTGRLAETWGNIKASTGK